MSLFYLPDLYVYLKNDMNALVITRIQCCLITFAHLCTCGWKL